MKKRSRLILVIAAAALAVIGLLAFALIPALQELVSKLTATPFPPVGLSGDKPAQLAEVVSVPNWNVKVLEVSRGDAAWSAIHSADELNEPPPPGKEYLLAKLWVKSTAADDEAHPISQSDFVVTGDRLIKYYTAEALEPDGWLHTGDLGYMDHDGFVFVTGRIKELVIKGGENISPREIDEVLYKHPAVLEAAAVGIPDDQYGEEIVCCCVLKPDCECTEEELREYCREHLGDFKTPKMVKVVEEIPKGPSGKLQRLKLREIF